MQRKEKHRDFDFEKAFEDCWELNEHQLSHSKISENVYKSISNKIYSNKSRAYKLTFFRYASILVVSLGITANLASTFFSKKNENINRIIENKNMGTTLKKIILNDGSIVLLYPKSKLSYDTDFNKKDRRVFLEGSGSFKITKNKNKPFYIEKKSLLTKVLGTTFDIKDLNDSLVEVKLIEGKIEVTNKKNTFKKILTKGKKLTYNRFLDELIKENKQLEAAPIVKKSFKDKFSIRFVNKNIIEIYKELSKKTGIPIDYSKVDTSNNFLISYDFKDKDIKQIINTISSLNGSFYLIENESIVIKN